MTPDPNMPDVIGMILKQKGYGMGPGQSTGRPPWASPSGTPPARNPPASISWLGPLLVRKARAQGDVHVPPVEMLRRTLP